MPSTLRSRPGRRMGMAALLLAAGTAVAACGGADGGAAGDNQAAGTASAIPDNTEVIAAIEADPELSAALPPAIAQSKTINLGSNIQSAPNNFYAGDGKTPIGYEVDLAKAIAAKLGVQAKHQDMAFGSLITSLQSGRVDMTMAAMNDTKERQQQIDFVDYFSSGITIMIQKGNPDNITGPESLCGKNVAVVQGTSHQKFAAEQSRRCEQDGKPPVNVTATDSDTQNQNQLRTGRVAAILNDLPSAVYISRTAGDGNAFEVVPGPPIEGGPYGIGFNKNNVVLRDAVAKALGELMTDGTYATILESWGVEQGALKEPVINGGS
ncbi:ABC transporter substrate-binding protein [Mycolicibacterium goodii]|uniref:ABC transporter substrate-binding protein n=2 Tax=Mycolicibacterium goodii TaxID=134601 RepID=A0ABS6HQI3_MYCGD|nr:ABC transporter substrate-binding protein [Mycolicibacterium goodii]MBU8840742.1 ABC transporter substrate-binding protein [Mycolicibacterium goodii]